MAHPPFHSVTRENIILPRPFLMNLHTDLRLWIAVAVVDLRQRADSVVLQNFHLGRCFFVSRRIGILIGMAAC